MKARERIEFWISRRILNLLRRLKVFVQLPPKQTILCAPQLFKFLLPTALHCQLPKKFLIKTYTCKLLEDSIRGGNISKEYKTFFLPELDVRRPEEIFEFYRYGSISIIQLVRVDLADIVTLQFW